MTGFFSRMFDPPRRPGFFGGDLDLGAGASQDAKADDGSAADDTASTSQWRRSFFALDPNDLLFPPSALGSYFGSLAPIPFGLSPGQGAGAITPVVADFGRRGRAATDIPFWAYAIRGFPSADPFMLAPPPDFLSNMPIIKSPVKPVIPPWVDKEGHPHLDNWNPEYNGVVTPGRGV